MWLNRNEGRYDPRERRDRFRPEFRPRDRRAAVLPLVRKDIPPNARRRRRRGSHHHRLSRRLSRHARPAGRVVRAVRPLHRPCRSGANCRRYPACAIGRKDCRLLRPAELQAGRGRSGADRRSLRPRRPLHATVLQREMFAGDRMGRRSAGRGRHSEGAGSDCRDEPGRHGCRHVPLSRKIDSGGNRAVGPSHCRVPRQSQVVAGHRAQQVRKRPEGARRFGRHAGVQPLSASSRRRAGHHASKLLRYGRPHR